MAYGDFKDLTRKTDSDKILCDKVFNIAKNPKYDGYQCGIASMVHQFFYEKPSGSGIKNEIISNKELTEELHKPIIRKFKKMKSTFNFCRQDLGSRSSRYAINIVRISSYKNIFAKSYVPNCSEEVFVIKKVKNTVPWTYVISDFKGEEIVGTFYEKAFQKTNQNEFRVEKVIKRKDDKLYVKWKGYNSSFNSWINKKDIV